MSKLELEQEVGKIQWHNYGRLRPPTEDFGFEKLFYDEEKKKELFTDTKNYITNRNTFLQKEKNTINLDWSGFMDKHKDIPYGEREKLANRIATEKFKQIMAIAEEIYPNSDLAYKSQLSSNVAQNVLSSNISKPSKKDVEDTKL